MAAARLPFIAVAANEDKRKLPRIELVVVLFEIPLILWRSKLRLGI